MNINARTFHTTSCSIFLGLLIACFAPINSVNAEDMKPGVIKKKYIHTCPAGTERVGEGPPSTSIMFCRQPLHNTSRLEGNYATFFQNGNKKLQGEYSQGKKHGKWVQYYRTGEVREVKKYLDGKPLDAKTFRKDGKQISVKNTERHAVNNNGKVYSELRQMRRKGNTKGRLPTNMGWPSN